jgi:DNA-binding NarL/FixJ family response regulator
MSSTLIKDKTDLSYLLNDEVILLEDSIPTQEIIKEIFEGEYNWRVTVVENKEGVINLLQEKHPGFFIFDIWVGNCKQEGLHALEQLRAIDKNVFVAIFSGYENHRTLALRLGCNLFEDKSTSTRDRVRHIADEMLRFRLKVLETITDQTISQLNSHKSSFDICSNDNSRKYQELVDSDSTWLNENLGKYAIFADGKWIKSSKDNTERSKEELLKWFVEEEKYKNSDRFIVNVKDSSVLVIDEPSSFLFEDFSY